MFRRMAKIVHLDSASQNPAFDNPRLQVRHEEGRPLFLLRKRRPGKSPSVPAPLHNKQRRACGCYHKYADRKEDGETSQNVRRKAATCIERGSDCRDEGRAVAHDRGKNKGLKRFCALTEVRTPMRKEDGCLFYDLHVAADDPSKFLFSRELGEQRASRRSRPNAAHRQLRARVKELSFPAAKTWWKKIV